MKNLVKTLTALFIVVGGLFNQSCSDDYLDVEAREYASETQLTDLYNRDPSALQSINTSSYALTFNYGGNHDESGIPTIFLGTDLMSADMVDYLFHWYIFYYLHDNRLQNFRSVNHMWSETLYPIVSNSNSIIRVVDLENVSTDLAPVIGEAYAYRGFAYLYLARLFQQAYVVNSSLPGVPLYGDSPETDLPGRNTLQEVYDFIISDFNNALNYLDGYVRSGKNQFDTQVVSAYLAQAYMDVGDYANAASFANAARQGYSPMSETEYKSGFADLNLSEVMWGAIIDDQTTNFFASWFSHLSNIDPGYAGVLGVYKAIDNSLLEEISDTDYRKDVFDGASIGLPADCNIKFYSNSGFTGDLIYLRASEMYLLEAEALARNNQSAQAAQVLFDLVSQRDSGYSLSSNSGEALIDEIWVQKRIELWGEGRSYFDLKRMDKGMVRNYSGTNHTIVTGADFDVPARDIRWTFQIPESEINGNSEIAISEQNP